jgi:DNA integrity scanning protein DisA with diadenylate cyclase activity
MKTAELFLECETITQNNLTFFETKLLKLSENQLHWKPSENTWNILEICAHLNEYAAFYHPAFTKKIASTRFREPRVNFISSPLGKSAWKSMKLGQLKNIKRKFNAARNYNPIFNKELVKGDDTSIFVSFQDELLRILESAKQINIQRAKVPISISKFIRLRIGDAFLFVIYHNERHIQQISNLLAHRAFPVK